MVRVLGKDTPKSSVAILAAYDALATRCAAAEANAAQWKDRAERSLAKYLVADADLTAARAQVAAMEAVVNAAKAYAEACKDPGQDDADGFSNADRWHDALIAAALSTPTTQPEAEG